MDCLEGMKAIPDGSVDAIITSPPYYNAREYSQWPTYQDYLNDMKAILSEAVRCLKPGRMCCINICSVIEPREKRSAESKRYALQFDWYNLAMAMELIFAEDIIWVKPQGAAINRGQKFFHLRRPMSYNCTDVTEHILVFRKKGKKKDDVLRDYSDDVINASLVQDGYEQTNVWRINPKADADHPAVFPIEIPTNLANFYTFHGDTILDPFMGSGTSAIAAIRTRRNYIGFELNEEYYRKSLDRIQRELSQPSLNFIND